MKTYEQILADIKTEFPEFQLKEKSKSFLMNICHYIIFIFTLGMSKNFITNISTTVGYTIYTPSQWSKWSENDRSILLEHERIHMRQKKKYGFRFYLMYFTPITLFSYWRMKFEQEAYAVAMTFDAEIYGLQEISTPGYRAAMIEQFVGVDYFWCWFRKKEPTEWFDQTLAQITKELSGNSQ